MRQPLMLICLVVLAATSCAADNNTHSSFTPLERRHGETLEGYTEALYDLSAASGRLGEAKLWSQGAYVAENTAETLVHVGFDLENAGAKPLTLDPTQIRLESVQTETDVLRDIPASAPQQPLIVAPKSTGRVELVFTLPSSIAPKDIIAFRVAWSVRANGEEYSEFTPFARTAPSTYYVPVHAYYYPYYSYYWPYYDPLWRPRSRVVIISRRYPRRVIVRGRPHRSHR